MSALPHPIQYQGSKRHLAARILEYFPDDVQTLYEPFSGSAAMSIAAAACGMAQRFVINDLNQPLAKLLQSMVENPQGTSDVYGSVWAAQGEGQTQSVAHFNAVRDKFNQTQEPELLLYLLARCIKGAVRYNREGLFNQSPDKRRKGTRPPTMQRNIFGISYLLKGRSSFSSMDYRLAIKDVQEHDLIYMDPPYQGVSGERDGRYLSGLAFDVFVDSLDALNQRGISYIVSYDGKLGERVYGQALPERLELERLELDAGRSSTATLLGRDDVTIESLYLSKPLIKRLTKSSHRLVATKQADSLALFPSSYDAETFEAVH
nr:DNA adenine methylase [Rhodoferax sp.]